MRYFDTHAHLNDDAFDADREALFASLKADGVDICLIGWDLPSSRFARELAYGYDCVFAAGVCPQKAYDMPQSDIEELRALLRDERCVLLGEIGLDYHWQEPPRDVQRRCLDMQSALAKEEDMPISYHVRDAWGDFMAYLAVSGVKNGIMHCFSGSADIALECVRAGLYISFSGSLTFRNARKLKEAASVVPPDRLLVETDCPYLCPEPKRGQRNEPGNVRYTLAELARLRDMSEEDAAKLTWDNAHCLMRI